LTFAALQQQAKAAAQSPEEAAAAALRQRFGRPAMSDAEIEAARGRFRRHFGTFHGEFGSADNESIDADLAREYGDSHENG
jgi:hypothetical protein